MKKLTLLLSLFLGLNAISQQETILSQYTFDGIFLNPAYTGHNDYFSSTLIHRNQWTNFEGAPKTSLLGVYGPLKDNKMGVGLTMGHEVIGVTKKTDVHANYAYNLKLGSNSTLAFGIKGGISNFVSNDNSLVVWDDGDTEFMGGRTMLLPSFGFGTYFNTDKFFAGLSIPTLLAKSNDLNFGLDISKSSFLDRHYFLFTGYLFELNEDFKLKPSTLIKYVSHAPLQADINLQLSYKDMLWFGTSYRSGDALVTMIEFQTNLRFRVGYAYDITLSDIRRFSNGTHEIMLGYSFGDRSPGIRMF